MSETHTVPIRSPKQQRFRDRYGPWAVVTGASDGIAREIALRLAECGLHLVLVARRRERLSALEGELVGRHGIEVRVVDADLSAPAGIAAVEDGTRDLDVGLLVGAAGFGTAGAFLDAELGREYDMLAVNCRAVLALNLHFGRRFAERGRGGMILFGSLVGSRGCRTRRTMPRPRRTCSRWARRCAWSSRRAGWTCSCPPRAR